MIPVANDYFNVYPYAHAHATVIFMLMNDVDVYLFHILKQAVSGVHVNVSASVKV